MIYPPAHNYIQRQFHKGWTAEENSEAAMLWQANYTAKQIGERLGRSRNSVLGKINRMGLIRSPGKRRGAMK